MLGDHDCANCKAPTCVNCGLLVGNPERHSAKCRRKPQILEPGQCPEKQLRPDAKGRIRSLFCALEDDHDLHKVRFEGYEYKWFSRELVA